MPMREQTLHDEEFEVEAIGPGIGTRTRRRGSSGAICGAAGRWTRISGSVWGWTGLSLWHEVDGGVHCNRFFKRAQDVKAHLSRKVGGCELKPWSRAGSLAEKAVELDMRARAAAGRAEPVCLEGQPLTFVYLFLYLGYTYQGDGERHVGATIRMDLAKVKFAQLQHVWAPPSSRSSRSGVSLKVNLFRAGIVSVLCYGLEAWWMDEALRRKLRSWNARCLHRITGRSHRDETVDPSFDFVRYVLARW